jgi:hypothetical protein
MYFLHKLRSFLSTLLSPASLSFSLYWETHPTLASGIKLGLPLLVLTRLWTLVSNPFARDWAASVARS